MQPACEVRLGIDCGSVSTVAVLVGPDGRWVPLLFDGAPRLLSAVSVDANGASLAGAAAWQHAATAPERFVLAPLRRLRDGRIAVGSGEVEAVDLVAATLRRVGDEAARVAGGPVGDVRLVVPAGWGPRRRTLLRQAAHRAGLGQPTLVEAPVAAAGHVLAAGARILVGSFIAVCDFGGGFEATVLRRTPTGFEVLATMDSEDAGVRRLDHLLADRVAALAAVPAAESTPAGRLSDGERLMLLSNVGTAREALTHSASVAVALPPPAPAVVLDTAQLEAVARPVLVEAARVVRRVVDAAEIETGQLAGVYCVGGAASSPLAVRVLAEETGLSPVVVDEPQLAAALGAAQAVGSAATGETTPQVAAGPPLPPLPPLRRAAGMLVSGLASLALVVHFVASAELNRTHSRGFYDPNAYVLANWGELAMAAVFALITCLAAATLLASTLPSQDHMPQPGGSGDAGQIGSGLLAAVALGLTIGGLYAMGASVYFDLPNGPFLRWALLPVLPIAAVVAVTAVLATRWGKTPARGWHGWLNFPASSVLCAAAGMLLVQVSVTARVYPSGALLNDLVGRGGAGLLGLGAALAVVASPRYWIILGAPLAVFCMEVVSWPATGMLGVLYVGAATLWWLQRVWDLVRQPGQPRLRIT